MYVLYNYIPNNKAVKNGNKNAMDKNCKYAKYAGDIIICVITNQICGNVKFCRAEKRWKNNESAVNCTIPKRRENK